MIIDGRWKSFGKKGYLIMYTDTKPGLETRPRPRWYWDSCIEKNFRQRLRLLLRTFGIMRLNMIFFHVPLAISGTKIDLYFFEYSYNIEQQRVVFFNFLAVPFIFRHYIGLSVKFFDLQHCIAFLRFFYQSLSIFNTI